MSVIHPLGITDGLLYFMNGKPWRRKLCFVTSPGLHKNTKILTPNRNMRVAIRHVIRK